MRVGDVLYFSPRYKFAQIDWNDGEALIDCFEDRVRGLYLHPAAELDRSGHGFAVGLLCVATIDMLARISLGGAVRERFVNWMDLNMPQLTVPDSTAARSTLCTRFYEDYRNGLVHEARVKNLGQFSYACEGVAQLVGGVMVVNPRLLLHAVEAAFQRYVSALRQDDCALDAFRRGLRDDFGCEVERAKILC